MVGNVGGKSMATYLMCSTPVHGHVSPMTTIGRHLASRGHRVIMLTGTRFAERVERAGMRFVPLVGRADFDDRDAPSYLPDRDRYRGLAQAQYDIQNIFVKTIPAQYESVTTLLRAEPIDAILVDGAFAGVAPLLVADGPRPPILAIGVTPLTQLSRDAAPAGLGMAPSASFAGRIRNRALNALAAKVLFRATQNEAQRAFAAVGAPRSSLFVMDLSRVFDRFLQLGPPQLEYPRSDLTPNVRFIGSLPVEPGTAPLPEWWPELDGRRPVVHVTQGTIDNHDLDRLIRPTIEALSQSDADVVVSMGGRPVEGLGAVPDNVRVAAYLPYDLLLPLTDVFVTNGGFGGVQSALAAGVPVVVAGDTEDKPEVAARVGWSGAGINLRTGTPTPDAVGAAVRAVLAEPRYRAGAREFAAALAEYDALAIVEDELARAVASRPSR
jgi:MGT family glycosyltransferase